MGGTRRVARAVDAWDAEVFRGIAAQESPVLDIVLPDLGRAANFSVLWLGFAGGLSATGRRGQQAARRGLASVAVASLLTNQVDKRVLPRARPPLALVPLVRRAARVPTSGSLPSR